MGQDIFSNIIIQKISTGTRDNALKILADQLIENGYVKPGFDDAVIARENVYPTGLHTLGIKIAIPHTDVEWTLVPALAIGMLDEPVTFKPMGGQGTDVQVGLIFMLSLSDPSAHIDFLRAFSKIIEDEEVMKHYGESQDIQYLINQLRLEFSNKSTSLRPSP